MGIERIIQLLDELKDLLNQAYEIDPSCPSIARTKQFCLDEIKKLDQPISESMRLSRILAHFRTRPFGIISAFKADKSDEKNLEQQYKLTQDIRRLGYGYIPIVGKWAKIPERSLFIPNISKDEIVELAKRYDQEAYLWGEKGKWAVYDTKTDEVYGSGTRFRVIDIDNAFDNYSAQRFLKKKGEPELTPDEERIVAQYPPEKQDIVREKILKGKKLLPVRPFKFEDIVKYFSEGLEDFINKGEENYDLVYKTAHDFVFNRKAPYIESIIEELEDGDLVYAEPNQYFSGLRGFIFNSMCLYVYEGDGKFREYNALLEEVEDNDGSRIRDIILKPGTRSGRFPPYWLENLFILVKGFGVMQ